MADGHRFPYKWKRTDLAKVTKHGRKVFSTFACGGGSSFGYKMAGFEVIGCNEIDPEMMELYKANHHPTHAYLEPIQTFKKRGDLPEELFDLDILDGSPPCSTFSMSGSREDAWGKEKKFREGQAKQVLSDLFFDYLDVVGKLKPRTCVAENVKGMIIGKAKGYCKLIRQRFWDLGYDVQLFLLNAASMGVPQARERVFFIARRRDLCFPPLRLSFDEKPVTFREVSDNLPFQDLGETEPSDTHRAFWKRTRPGDNYSTAAGDRYFNFMRLAWDKPAPTILGSSKDKYAHPDELRLLSWIEVSLIGSYPYDYDYLGKNNGMKVYCIGMSVPPAMTAHVAAQMAQQWFEVDPTEIDEAW
jgi:DNA (cytosine-5)-methyltransferase 1